MASFFGIQTDVFRRINFIRHELTYVVHKYAITNVRLPVRLRHSHCVKLQYYMSHNSITRARNRCLHSGRASAVFTHSRFSRLAIKELAGGGALTGFAKASW